MQVLVTGGAGFIGSHLCEKLIADGHRVCAVDDLSTGRLKNLGSCSANEKFQFVKGSVLDESLMKNLIGQSEKIYHLAAAVGVDLIVKEPVRTIETNIRGTEIVLEIAKRFSCPVMLASSSEVYGKNENLPFREDDDCLLGSTTFSRWSYACSKAIDEFLGLAYFKQFGLPVVIARIFNTAGERQIGWYGMVIPRFVKAALVNEPIQVYGDGKQTRCFSYVRDVVDGIVAVTSEPRSAGNVYNIGSTDEISIENLAFEIKKLTGSSSEIRYVPYEEAYHGAFDDMNRRVPCLDKIQKLVGYRPKTPLRTILEIVVDYFRREELD